MNNEIITPLDLIPANMNIHNIKRYIPELEVLRATGLVKGQPTGFKIMYDHYSVKEGSTTYIIGSPTAGKTSMLYEILINLAEYADWKIAIFSPEGGAPKDLFAELLWAYLRQPFLKHNIPNVANCTDKQVQRAYEFMEKHFYIIDSGLSEMSVEKYYKAIDDIENEFGHKVNAITIDPVLELNINPDNVREDVALNQFLTRVRKYSSQKNVHTFISVHTRAQQMVSGLDENGEKIFYYPQPNFFDFAGGQNYSRKGMMILSLWRPPKGLLRTDGTTYGINETIVEVVKVKPKIMGKIGKFSLYYDYLSSRYYEEINGDRYFSRDINNINKPGVDKPEPTLF